MSRQLVSSWRSRTAALSSCCLSAFLVAGCFGAQAKTLAVQPLDMPAPPPRIVEVSAPVAPPPLLLPEEPVHGVPSRVRPAVPDVQRAQDAPKPDSTAEPARANDDATRPASTALQTTSTRQEAETERRIRGELAQAVSDLARVTYQSLDADARLQYDTARRFISQAEDAVRTRNLVFASNLADKAAMLAAQLAGR